MGLTNHPHSELHNVQEIYEEAFDADVQQSAIYKEVCFSCINEKIFGIVLTPACDIFWQKADYVKMAGLIPAEYIFEQWLKKNEYTDEQIAGIMPLRNEGKVRKMHNRFTEWYIGNREIRYHFLPSYKTTFSHSFIDFQLVESFDADDVKRLEKIGVLKSPWRESVPARYAAYRGRVGTKEYSHNLAEEIIRQISHLTFRS